MWEHAPLAPLFPYTTLFRSLAGSDDAGGFAVVHRGDPPHSPAAPEGDEQPRLGVGEEGVATADLLAGVAAERRHPVRIGAVELIGQPQKSRPSLSGVGRQYGQFAGSLRNASRHGLDRHLIRLRNSSAGRGTAPGRRPLPWQPPEISLYEFVS